MKVWIVLVRVPVSEYDSDSVGVGTCERVCESDPLGVSDAVSEADALVSGVSDLVSVATSDGDSDTLRVGVGVGGGVRVSLSVGTSVSDSDFEGEGVVVALSVGAIVPDGVMVTVSVGMSDLDAVNSLDAERVTDSVKVSCSVPLSVGLPWLTVRLSETLGSVSDRVTAIEPDVRWRVGVGGGVMVRVIDMVSSSVGEKVHVLREREKVGVTRPVSVAVRLAVDSTVGDGLMMLEFVTVASSV